jgi:hypothetical protein
MTDVRGVILEIRVLDYDDVAAAHRKPLSQSGSFSSVLLMKGPDPRIPRSQFIDDPGSSIARSNVHDVFLGESHAVITPCQGFVNLIFRTPCHELVPHCTSSSGCVKELTRLP